MDDSKVIFLNGLTPAFTYQDYEIFPESSLIMNTTVPSTPLLAFTSVKTSYIASKNMSAPLSSQDLTLQDLDLNNPHISEPAPLYTIPYSAVHKTEVTE